MKDKVFFDTNILIYSVMENNPEKRKKAYDLICSQNKECLPFLSTQSLQEFYNVATKKYDFSKEDAGQLLEQFESTFDIYINKTKTIHHAISISRNNQLSFWDSLILAAANESGCSVLYSEDMNNRQTVENVMIVNPFLS